MTYKYDNPLSDMSGIKRSVLSLFDNTEDLTRLITSEHCFDTPYTEGAVTENGCAVFVETYLSKIENQHMKEVGVDIMIVCHKDSVKLSEEEKTYYESIGIYGNRMDCAVQIIHSSILNLRQNYSIGAMNLLDKNPLEQYVPGTSFYGKILHYTYQAFYQRKNKSRQVIS